ncbi:lecithin retinol acyltransferase family protein [Cyanobacterium stanieri LEGE 03274]|uniref:Lecithin retinol acyltransferase family protein n=1 Tax=Cyanobacterium stanieri LEGE 03274 TaxID=1828756 RepID=A0ABR9V360_9CHRO|nr:lecithin retinol acyltransferase family protein [Cyanobacterium stanieri]MBE9222262.1 lecithin retinol acyltransferase family protein [Cyanobacterium stanieri LEGE 03274]
MAKGDQLYVWRKFANLDGVYQHHGIDTGDGNIIHYRKPSEVVEKTSFNTFSKGNRVYIRQYPRGFSFIPDIVIERAFSRLGEKKYNLLFNNCEHFATWCKTGINDSKQVQDFIPTINKLNTFNLFDPLKTAFKDVNSNNTENIINSALNDIRVAWNRIQPEYKEALKEVDIWQKVAYKALQNNREDLAREALIRKKKYQTRVNELQSELEKLATMTEGLIQSQK